MYRRAPIHHLRSTVVNTRTESMLNVGLCVLMSCPRASHMQYCLPLQASRPIPRQETVNRMANEGADEGCTSAAWCTPSAAGTLTRAEQHIAIAIHVLWHSPLESKFQSLRIHQSWNSAAKLPQCKCGNLAVLIQLRKIRWYCKLCRSGRIEFQFKRKV